MGYKIHAFKGVSWVALLRGSTRGLTFLRLAILARLLSPTQFGVFGVATLILAFLEIITETGINVFLIQKKEAIEDYISSAWAISIIRGCIISLVLVISAPFVADFFRSPESQSIIFLIAIVPFIRGFINPSIVKIQKEIEFKKEFYLRITLFAVDTLVVIIVAFITRNAESFVLGLIASAILEVILSFLLFKPTPRFEFEVEKLVHIVKKSWWVTISGIFSYTADNGDNIAVGRLINTSSLGIYQAAYKISTLPISEVTDTVNKVVFPVYSKFSEDKDRLFTAFKKVTLVSSVVAFISGAIIFLLAEPIVLIILGENWIAAVPVVKILAVYGVLRTIFGNFAPVALSLHKQNYVAFVTFIRCIGLLITIVPFIYYFGINGAAYSVTFSILLEIPFVLILLRRIFKS